jgi:CRISPR-associated protein Cas2
VADPQRWRAVHKILLGYGDALQYSVFYCQLSEKEKALMVAKLADAINFQEDRVMIADLHEQGERILESVEFLGKPLSATLSGDSNDHRFHVI